jgi:hypothetical protein
MTGIELRSCDPGLRTVSLPESPSFLTFTVFDCLPPADEEPDGLPDDVPVDDTPEAPLCSLFFSAFAAPSFVGGPFFPITEHYACHDTPGLLEIGHPNFSSSQSVKTRVVFITS